MTKMLEMNSTRRGVLIGMGAGLTAMSMPNFSFAQAAGKVVQYGLSTFPPSLNPWDNTGSAAGTVKLMTMRGLTGYDNKAKLQPELAESWEQPDTKTYVFKLRQNVVFHDGKPFTSKDVVSTFERILAKDSSAFLKADLSIIDKVEAVDDHTVRFTLSSPCAVLLDILASYSALVISADSTPDAPVGCGPFKIKAQEKGVFIEVERNADFYKKGEPKVPGIRFTTYADENLRFAALQSGDLDIIEYLPWQAFKTVEASSEMKMTTSLGPFMFVLFNTTSGPFANVKVRQAVGYAIQRADVIKAAFAGYGEELAGFPNPEGSPFDLKDPAAQWTFDPEKAKALLTEAGYPNGFECRLLATSTYGMHQDTASVVQAYLQMIGINATLALPEWASRVKDGKDGKYDIAVHGSSGRYNDPDALYTMLHSANPSYVQSFGFKSERIDTLLTQGRAELDLEKRKAIYMDLAKAYFEEVPQVPLCWRTQAFGMKKSVEGFSSFPGFLNNFSPYSVDETTVG